jgi:putative transposase
VTANPNGAWVAQQARNLLEEQGRRLCFVLRDRDAKFTHRFDDVFGSHGAEMLLTPVQAPSYGRNLWMSPSHESAAYLPP